MARAGTSAKLTSMSVRPAHARTGVHVRNRQARMHKLHWTATVVHACQDSWDIRAKPTWTSAPATRARTTLRAHRTVRPSQAIWWTPTSQEQGLCLVCQQTILSPAPACRGTRVMSASMIRTSVHRTRVKMVLPAVSLAMTHRSRPGAIHARA